MMETTVDDDLTLGIQERRGGGREKGKDKEGRGGWEGRK